MEITPGAGTHTVTARDYVLEVRSAPPRAVLADPDGRIWSHLSLLASVDRVDVPDESLDVGVPVVRARGDHLQAESVEPAVEVELTTNSTAWDRRTTVLRCFEDRIELNVRVEGAGRLCTVRLLGGRAALRSGACGSFRSSIEFASVFNPTPTEPIAVVRPAYAASSLGVLGDALPGRLHGVFSPPPLCLALGRHTAQGATDIPEGPWFSLAVLGMVTDLRFTEMRYEPVDGGFHVALDYDGQTVVTEEFTTPTLLLRPAADPQTALRRYRDDLVVRGMAPETGPAAAADWWSEPIFCGWGAQCARAPLPGAPSSHPYYLQDLAPALVPEGVPVASELARQDVYDDLLARLAHHGIVPGTIVIDDQWQSAYGTAEPDTERWPDLRRWIGDQHAAGRRVLLWWKAWDPAGLPPEQCVLDATGRPVSVDPGNPAYQANLERIVDALLGADGLCADGFKVDFTQRSPAGTGLRPHREPNGGATTWGIAGLHALLSTLHRAAHAARPDALVVTHTPHPSFGDVCDMVRLNDVLERDTSPAAVPVTAQLAFRHAVVHASLPHHLVDTDQWPMPDREEWRRYARAQAAFGVPALYYVERIDRTLEELGPDDLAVVSRTWRDYRESRAAAARLTAGTPR